MPTETNMSMRDHVEGLAAGGSWYHTALLAHGRLFTGHTPSRRVRDASRWSARAKPRWHMCYLNSGEFVLTHKKAEYWEGMWLYAAGDSPTHHAWVVLGGLVVDFTAEDAARRVRRRGFDLLPPPEQQYFGLHIPTDVVRQRVEPTRVCGPVSPYYLNELILGHVSVPQTTL